MNPEQMIASGILAQAVVDYREILFSNKVRAKDAGGVYTLKELEKFFKSSWCAYLLDLINTNYTGEDIVSTIKYQVQTGQHISVSR